MNGPLPIPPDYRALIGLLRCAIRRAPAERALLAEADWTATLRLARQHGVDTYLYPWLAEHAPALFSARADVPPDSAFAAWRTLFLEAIPRTLLRRRQLAEILAALARARIEVIPLKGAWLGETVYDDPVQRSMSDIDLLVRVVDRDPCDTLLCSLGYHACHEAALHSPFAYDQAYRHAAYPSMVELHWHFTSELTPNMPSPDLGAIWNRCSHGALFGQPVRLLTAEDQLAHMIHHFVHHSFALPLRGYLDLALFLNQRGPALNQALLETACTDWQLVRSYNFLPGLVCTLFDVPQPAVLRGHATPVLTEKYALALHILFSLPSAKERDSASMQARLKHAPFYARLPLVLKRIFMPRTFLAQSYPCARSVLGLPLAWLCRTRDVFVRHHAEYDLLLKPSRRNERTLVNAEMREELVRWFLHGTKKPE